MNKINLFYMWKSGSFLLMDIFGSPKTSVIVRPSYKDVFVESGQSAEHILYSVSFSKLTVLLNPLAIRLFLK